MRGFGVDIKMENKKIVILGLATLVILALLVFGYNYHVENKQVEAFNVGAQFGFETAIIEIAKIAVECETVPLTLGNNTLNMIAVDCIDKE